MLVRISEGDIASCTLQGADMRRFLRVLGTKESIGKDATTGEPQPNPFDEVALATTWGLLVFTFYSYLGKVTKAVNVDLLSITKDLVVSNDGVAIDRYESVIDELLLQAQHQLLTGKAGQSSAKKLPIVKPGKQPKPYEVGV